MCNDQGHKTLIAAARRLARHWSAACGGCCQAAPGAPGPCASARACASACSHKSFQNNTNLGCSAQPLLLFRHWALKLRR